MPLVTVLMPVYNGERFLADAINSVLGQTFDDYELLIVDDGSTDGTADIIRSYNNPKIRVITNGTRLRLSGALNRGIDVSQGKYIARMDSDDVCLPDRLLRQFRFMESHPEVGMCGGWVRAFGEHSSDGDVFRYPLTDDDIKATMLFDNPFAHPAVMLRKDLFEKHALRFDVNYYPAEDYELWVRASSCVRMANISQVLLEYRLHTGSMTLSGRSEMDAQACRILKPLFAGLELKPSTDEIMFHRVISTNRIPYKWNLETLLSAEQLLKKLVEANDRIGKYDKIALRKAVARVWFSVCYRSLTLGWSIVRRHYSARLGGLNDSLILAGALVKRLRQRA